MQRRSFESVNDLIDAMGGTDNAVVLLNEKTGADIGASAVSNWRTLGIPADWFDAFGKVLGFQPPRRLFKFRRKVAAE